MNIYIFENVEELTTNYHSGGGLVVIAQDEAEARTLIAKETSSNIISAGEWDAVIVHPLMDMCQPRIFVFPDAGCC